MQMTGHVKDDRIIQTEDLVKKTVTILALAAVVSAAAIATPFARDGGEDIGGGQQAWGTSPGQNPEDFPDCMVWSEKDRTYAWICGPPYPEDMPHR